MATLSEIFTNALQFIEANSFVEIFIAITTIVIGFLFGRILHQRKLEELHAHMNDAEKTCLELTSSSKNINEAMTKVQRKALSSKIIIASFALGFGVVVLQIYLRVTSMVAPLILFAIGGSALLERMCVWVWMKLLSTKKSKVEEKLKASLQSTETETQEMLTLLGPLVTASLKRRFEDELDEDWRKTEKEDCKLAKCYEEIKTYNELYELCKKIIAEMQVMNWCDICATSLNIDAGQIRLNEVESNVKMFKRAVDQRQKMAIERKQELANRLLLEWQELEKKLGLMCKRGCCIRFRKAIESVKTAREKQLLTLKNKLH